MPLYTLHFKMPMRSVFETKDSINFVTKILAIEVALPKRFRKLKENHGDKTVPKLLPLLPEFEWVEGNIEGLVQFWLMVCRRSLLDERVYRL